MSTSPRVYSGRTAAAASDSHVKNGILTKSDHRVAVRLFASPAIVWLDLALLTFSLVITTVVSYRMALIDLDLSAFLSLCISVRNLGIAIGCLCIWRFMLFVAGAYRAYELRSLARRLLMAVTLCTPVAYGAFLLRSTGGGPVRPTLLFWLLSATSIFASRGVLALSAGYVHTHTRAYRKAVVIGSGTLAQKLVVDLHNHPQWEYQVLGFVDSEPRTNAEEYLGTHLGDLEQLSDILMHQPVDEVFIALPLKSHYEQIQRAIELCESAGVQSQYLSNIFSTSAVTKNLHRDEDRVVLRMVHHDSRRYLKRMFDFSSAFFGILLISPILIVVALLVKFTSKGPIVFKQTRYGLNKRPFSMYKFRSMVVDAEKQQAALEHLNETSGPVFKIKRDPRITRIGAFIRKTSIDELPQLFNVLLGDMSLVGPRPLPMRDVSRFSELSLMRRFSVKPGMTGLWQVSGRSNLDFDGWIALDLRYIDTWSLVLDLKILAQTLPAVLKGRGAS